MVTTRSSTRNASTATPPLPAQKRRAATSTTAPTPKSKPSTTGTPTRSSGPKKSTNTASKSGSKPKVKDDQGPTESPLPPIPGERQSDRLRLGGDNLTKKRKRQITTSEESSEEDDDPNDEDYRATGRKEFVADLWDRFSHKEVTEPSRSLKRAKLAHTQIKQVEDLRPTREDKVKQMEATSTPSEYPSIPSVQPAIPSDAPGGAIGSATSGTLASNGSQTDSPSTNTSATPPNSGLHQQEVNSGNGETVNGHHPQESNSEEGSTSPLRTVYDIRVQPLEKSEELETEIGSQQTKSTPGVPSAPVEEINVPAQHQSDEESQQPLDMPNDPDTGMEEGVKAKEEAVLQMVETHRAARDNEVQFLDRPVAGSSATSHEQGDSQTLVGNVVDEIAIPQDVEVAVETKQVQIGDTTLPVPISAIERDPATMAAALPAVQVESSEDPKASNPAAASSIVPSETSSATAMRPRTMTITDPLDGIFINPPRPQQRIELHDPPALPALPHRVEELRRCATQEPRHRPQTPSGTPAQRLFTAPTAPPAASIIALQQVHAQRDAPQKTAKSKPKPRTPARPRKSKKLRDGEGVLAYGEIMETLGDANTRILREGMAKVKNGTREDGGVWTKLELLAIEMLAALDLLKRQLLVSNTWPP